MAHCSTCFQLTPYNVWTFFPAMVVQKEAYAFGEKSIHTTANKSNLKHIFAEIITFLHSICNWL